MQKQRDDFLMIPEHEIDAELCRRSFYYFFKYFFSEVISETPVFNWHIKCRILFSFRIILFYDKHQFD